LFRSVLHQLRDDRAIVARLLVRQLADKVFDSLFRRFSFRFGHCFGVRRLDGAFRFDKSACSNRKRKSKVPEKRRQAAALQKGSPRRHHR